MKKNSQEQKPRPLVNRLERLVAGVGFAEKPRKDLKKPSTETSQ